MADTQTAAIASFALGVCFILAKQGNIGSSAGCGDFNNYLPLLTHSRLLLLFWAAFVLMSAPGCGLLCFFVALLMLFLSPWSRRGGQASA